VTRSRARTLSVASAAFLAVAALSGCAAGLGADTSTPYSASLGTDAVIGNMHVDNVLVLDDGSVPELSMTLINQGRATDTLLSLEISGAGSVSLRSGGVDIAPSNFVQFGPSGTERVLVNGMTAGLGQLVTVTLLFRIAGSVSVSAIVTTPSNQYAGS
jgi:copper(I)-binding protein